jgi:hypothetical protein
LDDLKQASDEKTLVQVTYNEQFLILPKSKDESRSGAWEFGCGSFLIKHNSSLDIKQFQLDPIVCSWDSSQPAQSIKSLFLSTYVPRISMYCKNVLTMPYLCS